MALLSCKECSGKVSSLATTCPHCGCPVHQQLNPATVNQQQPPEERAPVEEIGDWNFTELSDDQIAQIRTLADSGELRAKVVLGKYYFEKDNWKDASDFLAEASKVGHAPSMWYYAEILMSVAEKKGSKEFEDRAQVFINGSAEFGFPEAQYYIAMTCRENEPNKAASYACKAAAQGHLKAAMLVGFFYQQGVGFEQDLQKAFECYVDAANRCCESAYFHVGMAYKFGLGIQQDPSKAVEWLTKALDVEDDGDEAHKELTEMLLDYPHLRSQITNSLLLRGIPRTGG